MDTPVAMLRAEFEAVASDLDIPLTTLGGRVGQGGHFHRRLVAEKRMWPETIEAVHRKLQQIRDDAACDASPAHAPASQQGPAARNCPKVQSGPGGKVNGTASRVERGTAA